MTHRYFWIEDPVDYTATSLTDQPEIQDAYSQWILTKQGRDFELWNELVKEHESDFTFVEKFNTLTGPGEFGLRSIPPELTSIDLAEGEVVVSLPLRKRSVQAEKDRPVGKTLNKVPEFKEESQAEYTLPEGSKAKDLVIVGIIDDSINICHERFRAGQKSRVDYAWVQDADWCEGSAPPFGRVLTRNNIDSAVEKYGHDEDKMFEALDLVGRWGDPYRPSPLRLRESHGTAVADLAAGFDSEDEGVANRRIITVQLPALVTQDTSGATLISALRNAAQFIFNRAYQISLKTKVPVPVILNISYGLNGGSRTGEHMLERTLRALALSYRRDTARFLDQCNGGIDEPAYGAPVEIVVPAGNQHLTRGHARSRECDVESDGCKKETMLNLRMRLQPNDRTSSYLEIWVPKSTENVSIEVTPPSGRSKKICFNNLIPTDMVDRRDADKAWLLFDNCLDNVICRVSLDEPNPRLSSIVGDNRLYWRILLALAPTEVVKPDRSPAPFGIWKISTCSDQCDGATQAWIQRDVNMPGFANRSRQAYFDDENYECSKFDEFGDVAIDDAPKDDSVVARNGTLSGLATSSPLIGISNSEIGEPFINTLAVGSNQSDTHGGSFMSAAGTKSAVPVMEGPHIMADSDTSRVLAGMLVSGSHSNSRTVQIGTSFAAPQVTRALALHIECLSQARRVNFDSESWVKGLGGGRPAKPNGSPETTRSPAIREERLRSSGSVLPSDQLHRRRNNCPPDPFVNREVLPKM